MAFWLAKERNGQDSDFIQRFDPRFWTVDFPRPMLASVVSTGPDALRVECEFHHHDALAGLIWWSEDTLDHPLLAYRTLRDYAHAELRFRWRSAGLIPLDEVHGPTLTIEGRDAAGAPRSWFVRLWNYAIGTPEDARIVLPFSALADGWAADGAPVHPADIDRMFVSLAPPGYDPASHARLPARANGWVELSEMRCDGQDAMLEIGDVLVPHHGTGMCTAYDDSYNQTPERLVRAMRGLGYAARFVHYVGMSHHYRLEWVDGALEANAAGELAAPAVNWHRSLFAACERAGFEPMVSVSVELLAQDCPPGWMQRAPDGAPALTGWEPPSTLLSPCVPEARAFLRATAQAFMALVAETDLPLRLQLGEPWWWVNPDGAICLYDSAARAAFSDAAAPITDMRAPLSELQQAVLDQAGEALAALAEGIQDALRAAMPREIEVWLLLFTPTILDPAMPGLRRANLPGGFAHPRFDGLQLEDYDWLTAGGEGRRTAAYAFMDEQLGYPPNRQEYLAGFVRYAADAPAFWRAIDAGLAEAERRGTVRSYVWALPQVARDGYTRIPTPEDEMQAFDDVLYPLALGRDAAVSPEFRTTIAATASGHERRNTQWADARLSFEVGPGIRSEEERHTLLAFFRARRGAARGFRIADPFDCSSRAMVGMPTPFDQLIGTGDGSRTRFALVKRYGDGAEAQERRITRPRAPTVRVAVGIEETSDFTLEDGGWIVLATPPVAGEEVRAGFAFDVPVRFASDRLDISGAAFAAGEAPSVPLVEIREAV
ncbi:TIGR02217 family protein [Erythrobacter sp. 3-20A1M]|uniref:DUF2460 domain-containing protein n=1 Tax=Erythrobacter sp. 3-20A1M TaxID=2653850 RepID=UPI001BFC3ACE|nr:DUF2460 domain-containing protein [Erythrobacter sp. 3-20A1M]QWC56926.1 TIGR02217 family protein [Erythrobacter sp. 3-20A1M]